MIKLIASDLDGTLLHNGAQKLTPRAIELIHELTQKGIHFVAASGRQYDNERRLFSEIKDEISYIGENAPSVEATKARIRTFLVSFLTLPEVEKLKCV